MNNTNAIYHNTALIGSVILGLQTLFYFLVDQQFANRWFPMILGAELLVISFCLRRIALSQLILSPIAWFLLVCALYYGAGPLVYIYGNDVTIERINSFYFVNQDALWRTNLLNIISIAIILFFFSIGMRLFILRPFKHVGDDTTLKKAAFLYACIGVVFTLIPIGLRLEFGNEFLMPGVFYTFKKLSHASLFLYSLLYFRGHREVKVQLLLITTVVGYFAVTSLMKQEILEFAMALFFGAFAARPSIRKLVTAFCIILITFPAIEMLTSYGRILTWESGSGGSINVGAMDLIRAASDTDSIEMLKTAGQSDQSLWRRISYPAAQAFAMKSYDEGEPGNSFESAIWALVPRLVYPDKPVITQGEIFTTLVKGEAIGGGTGAGFFGEAYWNHGWIGVMLVSMFVGLLLAVLTKFNASMVLTGNYQFFGVAFIAIAVGYRIDDWLIATTFNSIPLMVVLYIIAVNTSRRRHKFGTVLHNR